MNQIHAILTHLMDKGNITSMEAFQLYGCTRISAKIHLLRKRGYDIETIYIPTTNRYGDPVRYGLYKYHGRLNPAENGEWKYWEKNVPTK